MVDFWSNLLNVSLFHDEAIFWRMDYDRVIRANALTSFEAAPAADHASGDGPLPRQRLLVEGVAQREPRPRAARAAHRRRRRRLHRGPREGVGADAHRLPGRHLVAVVPAFYDPTVAPHPAGAGDGLQPRQLRRPTGGRPRRPTSPTWPSTRHRQPAGPPAVRQVRLRPADAGLSNAVARAYLDNDTAIKPTLRALVDHPDFAAAAGKKVRTPTEDYVATVRALGIRLAKPTSDESFANAMYWQYGEAGSRRTSGRRRTATPRRRRLGERRADAHQLHQPPRPGRPLVADRAGDVPAVASLLPPMPATLAEVIDHIGRRMLGQPPGPPSARASPSCWDAAHDERLTAGRGARVLDAARHPLVPARLAPPPAPLRSRQ